MGERLSKVFVVGRYTAADDGASTTRRGLTSLSCAPDC
jgi:hypothetical protein